MSKSEVLTIRLDKKTYQAYKKLCELNNVSHAEIIRLFIKELISNKQLAQRYINQLKRKSVDKVLEDLSRREEIDSVISSVSERINILEDKVKKLFELQSKVSALVSAVQFLLYEIIRLYKVLDLDLDPLISTFYRVWHLDESLGITISGEVIEKLSIPEKVHKPNKSNKGLTRFIK